MRFDSVEIFGFGKIKNNLKLNFAPKINVILAPNDRGKSTLIESVFAILYPFGDTRTDLGRKKRIRFKPWSSDSYGGRIDIGLNAGENYRIEKIISASPREDQAAVFQKTDQGLVPVKDIRQDKNLGLLAGRHFLGIGREVFESLSIVRQFDIASVGEGKKILDEVRSIIEVGKGGEGLSKALKKLQDKKARLGAFEKKGKRTIIGSKEARYDELKSDLKKVEEQFQRGKSLVIQKKNLQASWQEKKNRLEALLPEIKNLEIELAKAVGWIELEYGNMPHLLKEMGLKELQNLRNFRSMVYSAQERFKSAGSDINKSKKALKHNTVLTALSLGGFAVFLSFAVLLNLIQAKNLFFSFSFFLLLFSLYCLKLINADKKSIHKSERIKEGLLSEIAKKTEEFGLFKNVEQVEDFRFYEELWNGLLGELGISSIEELELSWHKSKAYAGVLKKSRDLNIDTKKHAPVNAGLDIETIDAKIESLKNKIQVKERLQNEIKNDESNIKMFDKTMEEYSGGDEIAVLNTECMALEEELKKMALYKDSLDLAIEMLQGAGEELYTEISPYINEFVNKSFSQLSEDYEFAQVNPDLEISIKPRDFAGLIDVEQVGKGMQTSLYLFLRFAIISLFALNRGETLPFILDETFNVFDDFSYNRQGKILKLLTDLAYQYNIQLVYFTCQKKGQFLPIKEFFESEGFILKEEPFGDFVVLQGGRDESEFYQRG
ncbi:MAG: AAA family ATPase [Candidatus Omnitrophica bacterium]|nr:AAA family ATPase [Candidatus Omnitrophota bacterium]